MNRLEIYKLNKKQHRIIVLTMILFSIVVVSLLMICDWSFNSLINEDGGINIVRISNSQENPSTKELYILNSKIDLKINF